MDKKQNMNKASLRIHMEVDGVKHYLVPDLFGDAFFGCKQCSLRDLCRPSELLCDELNHTECHFEKEAPQDPVDNILFGY